jgi:hypothetical protein
MVIKAVDRDSLLLLLKDTFNNTPGILKSYINPSLILNYIEAIPQNLRQYTLQEIIDVLEEARQNGNL